MITNNIKNKYIYIYIDTDATDLRLTLVDRLVDAPDLFFHNGEQRCRLGSWTRRTRCWSCDVQQRWHLEIHADTLATAVQLLSQCCHGSSYLVLLYPVIPSSTWFSEVVTRPHMRRALCSRDALQGFTLLVNSHKSFVFASSSVDSKFTLKVAWPTCTSEKKKEEHGADSAETRNWTLVTTCHNYKLRTM